MPYIYKITNAINNKIYIGKTLSSIEERWKEHCRDSVKPRVEKRPLYEAMNKYGKENFSIELVEECEEHNINEREIFWIEYLVLSNTDIMLPRAAMEGPILIMNWYIESIKKLGLFKK